MPSARSLFRSLAGAALTTVALVAPVQATPVFPVLPAGPLTLTGPGVTSYYAPNPVVAVNASGASVAAWAVSQGRANKFVAGEAQLYVSFRAAGAPADAWSTPIAISASDYIATSPQVGIDAQGTATIAWSEFTNGRTSPARVRVATATDSGIGPIQDFTATGGAIFGVTLAITRAGSAVLAFESERTGEAPQMLATSVLAARRATPTGAFTAPTTLSADQVGTRASAPVAATNAAGHLGVAWVEGLAGEDDTRVRMAQAAPGGEFGAPVEVSGAGGTAVSDPALTIDESGTATVGWSQSEVAPPVYPARSSVVVRRVSPGGGLGDRQPLSTADAFSTPSASQLHLAGDQAGQVTAVWVTTNPDQSYSPDAVQVATAPAGGAFGAGTTLEGYRTSPDVSLAVDPSGATAVGIGAAGSTMSVRWRAAAGTPFVGLGTVTSRWVGQTSVAFGRGPDDLTVLFATDYAPIFSVQTATTVSAQPATTPTPAPTQTPTPTPRLDTTAPTIAIGRVRNVLGPKPRKGRKRSHRLTAKVSASEPVRLRASLGRSRPGILRAGACIARPSGPKRKGQKACVRAVAFGTPVKASSGPAGASLRLGAAPRAGTYTLTVEATDAAGNRAVATKRFTLK